MGIHGERHACAHQIPSYQAYCATIFPFDLSYARATPYQHAYPAFRLSVYEESRVPGYLDTYRAVGYVQPWFSFHVPPRSFRLFVETLKRIRRTQNYSIGPLWSILIGEKNFVPLKGDFFRLFYSPCKWIRVKVCSRSVLHISIGKPLFISYPKLYRHVLY